MFAPVDDHPAVAPVGVREANIPKTMVCGPVAAAVGEERAVR
jgi:hypothetical protein